MLRDGSVRNNFALPGRVDANRPKYRMSWVRLDDQFAHHPKVLKAGPTASFLWISCIAYCQKFLTDGHIPGRAITTICDVPNPKKQADVLVRVGLLERSDDGYQVHDYLHFNESSESVKHRREADRQRKQSDRNPDGIQTESGRTPTRAPAPAPHPIPSIPKKKEQIPVSPTNGNGHRPAVGPSEHAVEAARKIVAEQKARKHAVRFR